MAESDSSHIHAEAQADVVLASIHCITDKVQPVSKDLGKTLYTAMGILKIQLLVGLEV